jgi:hypothetical protein
MTACPLILSRLHPLRPLLRLHHASVDSVPPVPPAHCPRSRRRRHPTVGLTAPPPPSDLLYSRRDESPQQPPHLTRSLDAVVTVGANHPPSATVALLLPVCHRSHRYHALLPSSPHPPTPQTRLRHDLLILGHRTDSNTTLRGERRCVGGLDRRTGSRAGAEVFVFCRQGESLVNASRGDL